MSRLNLGSILFFVFILTGCASREKVYEGVYEG